MSLKIKVALAEDNDFLACSIAEKLGFFSDDIEFSFRARNGLDLLEKLRGGSATDIILMDIEMPEMDGIEATEIVRAQYPSIKVLILTVFDDEDKIFRSIQAGAIGYMLKDESADRIVEGIKVIMSGGAVMSPAIAAKSLALLRQVDIPAAATYEKNDFTLSNREIEVLELLSHGDSHIAIAGSLFVSPSTIRKHIENIYNKLHVHNKMEAVQKAKKHKIIAS